MIAIIIFGLAALLIAAVMSWRLSGEFTRPLEEMATAAGRISDGDYDRWPCAERRDRRRGDVFSRMASSLRGSRAELRPRSARPRRRAVSGA